MSLAPMQLLRGALHHPVVAHPPAPFTSLVFPIPLAEGDRVSEFELKLMDISSENLGIPETEYAATASFANS